MKNGLLQPRINLRKLVVWAVISLFVLAASSVLIIVLRFPMGEEWPSAGRITASGLDLFKYFFVWSIAVGAGIAAVKRWVRG